MTYEFPNIKLTLIVCKEVVTKNTEKTLFNMLKIQKKLYQLFIPSNVLKTCNFHTLEMMKNTKIS